MMRFCCIAHKKWKQNGNGNGYTGGGMYTVFVQKCAYTYTSYMLIISEAEHLSKCFF